MPRRWRSSKRRKARAPISPAGSTEPVLAARELSRVAADGTRLLQDIDLQLRRGERLGLSGPSGSGKSLLLRALAQLDEADGGDVLWHGEAVEPDQIPSFRASVMLLRQRPAFQEGDVESNLRLPWSLVTHHRKGGYDPAPIQHLLAAAGRGPDLLRRDTSDLSGGEGQIVALIRALQLGPAVLLLDEPTAALDPEGTRAVEALLTAWRSEAPETRSWIWITHDEAQAERVSDRRLRLEAGRFAA